MSVHDNSEQWFGTFSRWHREAIKWLGRHSFFMFLFRCFLWVVLLATASIGVIWLVILLFGVLQGEPLPAFEGSFGSYFWFPAHWFVLSSLIVVLTLLALSSLVGRAKMLHKLGGIGLCLFLIAGLGVLMHCVAALQKTAGEATRTGKRLSEVAVLVQRNVETIVSYSASSNTDEGASRRVLIETPFAVVESIRRGSGFSGMPLDDYSPHNFRICPAFLKPKFEIAESLQEVRGILYLDHIEDAYQHHLRCFIIDATGTGLKVVHVRTFSGEIDAPQPGAIQHAHIPPVPYSAVQEWLRDLPHATGGRGNDNH